VGGHLFIINGDLTKIACDALLIPTDGVLHITEAWQGLLSGVVLPHRWGAETVLEVHAVPKEPRIWLGRAGLAGDHAEFAAFASVIAEFVKQAVAKLTFVNSADRIYPWPKPRLAINMLGTGYGGGSEKKGHLVEGLVKNLGELAQDHDVDIILVAFGGKSFAAAQRARHRIAEAHGLLTMWEFENDALVAHAQSLADAAIDNHLVLFIGAGVSAGAGLPTWNDLLTDVARDAYVEADVVDLLSKKDLRDQATLLERKLRSNGRHLRDEVAAKLRHIDRYSLQHGLLASLPSKEAVTTNFDGLFELASRVDGLDVAVLPEDPRKTNGQWLLKLHGSADKPDGIVLTRSDFLDMPRHYGALMGLVQGLLLMRHMMFIGYSLQDEDFHELIHEVRAARGDRDNDVGRGTVLTLFDDGLERELWEDDLDVVPMTKGVRTDARIPLAARELEMFLDLVAFRSTTSASFFLDETYSRLSDDEAPLRDALRALAPLTDNVPKDSVGYLVKRFLDDLRTPDMVLDRKVGLTRSPGRFHSDSVEVPVVTRNN